MKKLLEVLHESKKSHARRGIIHTSHGDIQTPAFVPVGTKGTIKGLTSQLIQDLHIQVSFVNTYHLVTHPGPDILKQAGGIHKWANYSIPLMSDSGGFQVFSLARKNKSEIPLSKTETNFKLKIQNSKLNIVSDFDIRNSNLASNSKTANIRGEEQPMVVKISQDGVKFRSLYDGQLIEFTPEKSMEYQQIIGADLLMAFDECTYYPATHEYAKKAMERTHAWLKRCIKVKSEIPISKTEKNLKSKIENSNFNIVSDFDIRNSNLKNQYLYGVIQGGTYEDLRKESAKFIANQDVSGVAIGGVSVGETKEEMRNQVEWVAPYLPKDKPVHLLGVGQIDDIIDLVGSGIDTFDCVEPTRLARMGAIYQINNNHFSIINKDAIGQIDINKGMYKANLEKVDSNCSCYVCQNFTKSFLHHLFKQRELLGYTLATYHNLWVMERLMEKIREMIEQDKL